MRIIAFGATKGGVGKSTLTAHIAVLAQQDHTVGLVDLDPQQSLTAWLASRTAPKPVLADAAHGLKPALARLRRLGIDLVLVDCPPGDLVAIANAAAAADLLVTPVQPSPTDLRAIGPTLDIAARTGTPYAFVVNRAIPRTRLAAEAPRALAEHGTVLATLYQRMDFVSSMTGGLTAGEIRASGKAAHEIAALWTACRPSLRRTHRQRQTPREA